MKPTSVVLLALGSVLTAAGCAPSPAPVAEVRQAGTLSQGTLSQGTLSQGTLSQGTLSQGTENAVWGFHREDWENERHGWTMVHGGVDKGHLIAEWGQTLNQFCWSGNTGVNRECRWLAGGAASCTRNNRETETVKVGVGGCGIGSASRAAYLRVCPGGKPCTHEQVIAASDHATTAPGKLCGQSE